MKDKFEVLVSSDGSCVAVYDDQTGNLLHQYKGGQTASRTVTWLGQDWLLSAGRDKPVINVWQVNKSELSPVRLFSPGPVSAMAASPSGLYLVIATQENLNIYLVSSGQLLGVLTRHYQPVICLAWTGDSSHFLSGGEDGQVLVWSLVRAVTSRHLPGLEESRLGQVEPRHTWTDHGLPVTAVVAGHGQANMARAVTASRDMTVKLYSLGRGHLLLSVSLTSPVTSLAMDNMETVIWAGCQSGSVTRLSLLSPGRDVTVTSESLQSSSLQLQGHTAPVTHLALSSDGYSLATADDTGNVHIWDASSGQIVRTINHKAAITHLDFLLTPPALGDRDSWSPAVKVVPLQKGLQQEGDRFQCILYRKNDLMLTSDLSLQEERLDDVGETAEAETSHTVEELKQINNQLYKYALKHVLDAS